MIVYALRSLLSIVLLALVLIYIAWGSYDANFANSAKVSLAISIIGEIDLLHDICYACLPAALIFVLIPSLKRNFRGLKLVLASLAAGCLAMVPLAETPLIRIIWTSNKSMSNFEWLIALMIVFVNALVATLYELGSRGSESRGLSWVRRLVIVADLLLPALVWQAYRHKNSRAMTPLRLVPGLIVLQLALLPWILHPLGQSARHNFDRELRQLSEGHFYQVLVDPLDGSLVAIVDEEPTVMRIDPRTGAVHRQQALPLIEVMHGVALDSENRRVIHIDNAVGKSFVFDADTLAILRESELVGAHENTVGCKTYWYAEQELLLNHCSSDLSLICPDGYTILTQLKTRHSHVLYDRRRDQILIIDWEQPVFALDRRTLEPVRHISNGEVKERMALDEDSQRLFISCPIRGEVLVVDMESFEVENKFAVFPGVRHMVIDPQRRWLIIAGMSPLLEIRSLDDYSLVTRMYAPPWDRWMALDQQRGQLYLTSGLHGLWGLDLERARNGTLRRLAQRIDPFYLALRILNPLLIDALGGSKASQAITKISILPNADVSCTDERWYEVGRQPE